jgi:hypothetical protein
MDVCTQVNAAFNIPLFTTDVSPEQKTEFCTFLRNGLYYQSIGNAAGALVSYSNAEAYLHLLEKLGKIGVETSNMKLKNDLEQRLLGYIEVLTEKTKELSKSSDGGDDKDDASDWKEVCAKVEPTKSGQITYRDIIGLKKEKGEVNASFVKPLLFPNLFPALSKGILLYGPPGTGKTFLVKGMISELSNIDPTVGVIFFAPTGAELKGKYVGETEKNIVKYFSCAARAACQRMEESYKNGSPKKFISILFIDEFDNVGGDRMEDPSGLMANSVNTILQMMDGVQSFKNVGVIAATNYPWKLDAAILRRFNSQIKIPIPKLEDNHELLINSYKRNIALKSFNAWCYCNNDISTKIYKPVIDIGALCTTGINRRDMRYHETPSGQARKIIIELPSNINFEVFRKKKGAETHGTYSAKYSLEPRPGNKTYLFLTINGKNKQNFMLEFEINAVIKGVDGVTFVASHEGVIAKRSREKAELMAAKAKLQLKATAAGLAFGERTSKGFKPVEKKIVDALAEEQAELVKALAKKDAELKEAERELLEQDEADPVAPADPAPIGGSKYSYKKRLSYRNKTLKNKRGGSASAAPPAPATLVQESDKIYKLYLFLADGTDKPAPNSELARVISNTVSTSDLEAYSPYNFFKLDFLKSKIIAEAAQIMSEKKYSNSDIDNIMSTISKQAGKIAIEKGSFIRYSFAITGKSFGFDMTKNENEYLSNEKYIELKDLEKYYVSSLSEFNKEAVQKGFLSTMKTALDSAKHNQSLKFLDDNFYISDVKGKQILTRVNMAGKKYYNAKLFPGFSITATLSCSDIDELFLEEEYIKKEIQKNTYYSIETKSKLADFDMQINEKETGIMRATADRKAALKKKAEAEGIIASLPWFKSTDQKKAAANVAITEADKVIAAANALISKLKNEKGRIISARDKLIADPVPKKGGGEYNKEAELEYTKSEEFDNDELEGQKGGVLPLLAAVGAAGILAAKVSAGLAAGVFAAGVLRAGFRNVVANNVDILIGKRITFTNGKDPSDNDRLYDSPKNYLGAIKNIMESKGFSTGGDEVMGVAPANRFYSLYKEIDPDFFCQSSVGHAVQSTYVFKYTHAGATGVPPKQAGDKYVFTCSETLTEAAKSNNEWLGITKKIIAQILEVTYCYKLTPEQVTAFQALEALLNTNHDDLLINLKTYINSFFDGSSCIADFEDIFKQEKMILIQSQINIDDPFYKELKRANLWHIRDAFEIIPATIDSFKKWGSWAWDKIFGLKHDGPDLDKKVTEVIESQKITAFEYLVARANRIASINISEKIVETEVNPIDFESSYITEQADYPGIISRWVGFRNPRWFMKLVNIFALGQTLFDSIWRERNDTTPALIALHLILSKRTFALRSLKNSDSTTTTLNSLIDYCKTEMKNYSGAASLDNSVFVIDTENVCTCIITKYEANKDVEKDQLVNFCVPPNLVIPALKTFPSTYNETLGNAINRYESDREKFLADRKSWPGAKP